MALQSPLTVLSAVANSRIQLRSHLQCWVVLGEIRADYNISFIIRLLPWKGLRVAAFSGRCEPLIGFTSVMDGLSKSPQLSNNSSNDKESQSGHITAGLQRQLSTDWYDHHRPVCSSSHASTQEGSETRLRWLGITTVPEVGCITVWIMC